MFTSTQNKGFQMTFKNGLTISVQFGITNYCERRIMSRISDDESKDPIITSQDAEIAIWDKEGTWFNFDNDTVKGWVKTDEVAHWIYLTKSAIHLGHLKNMAINWEMMGARASEA